MLASEIKTSTLFSVWYTQARVVFESVKMYRGNASQGFRLTPISRKCLRLPLSAITYSKKKENSSN